MSRISRFLSQAVVVQAVFVQSIYGEGHEAVHLWVEAENFTSATLGVQVHESRDLQLADFEKKFAATLIRTSGRQQGSASSVSGAAYAGWLNGDFSSGRMQYDFSVPKDGDYFAWIRYNNPPPCYADFLVWMDSPENKPPSRQLGSGLLGVWSWWPWGRDGESMRPKPFSLASGRHSLFLEDNRFGTRFDKILITDDPEFTPQGKGEQYYTRSFTPPSWPGSAHGLSDKLPATATGWNPVPTAKWKVLEDMAGNYYYYVTAQEPATDRSTLVYSLVENLSCSLFEANFSLIWRPALEIEETDCLLVFGFVSHDHFDAVRLSGNTVEYLETRDGTPSAIQTIPWSLDPPCSTVFCQR